MRPASCRHRAKRGHEPPAAPVGSAEGVGIMRVLQVGKYYPPVEGGIENHVEAVAEGLATRYDVTVLAFNTRARTEEGIRNGVRVVRVATMGRVLSTEIAPLFFSWFRRLAGADLIHLHTPNPIGELACLAAPAGTPLLVTYHSDVMRRPRLLGRLNRIVLQRLMRRADRVISFTRRYMESSPVISHHAGKCAIIPHGIDEAEYSRGPAIEGLVRRLRAEHGPRIVLFVGRLVYYKGVDILIRAMVGVPGAKLLVVGDGPLRARLTALARDLDLSGRVAFLGRVSHEEKVACYHASDLLVLPATHRAEAFGLVQVEALTCGLPVVSTNIESGVSFVNQDGVTGLLVQPGDAAGLAAAIARLLADPSLREEMARAGRRRALELFSRPVMLRDLLSLYSEILGPSGGGTAAAGGPLSAPKESVHGRSFGQ